MHSYLKDILKRELSGAEDRLIKDQEGLRIALEDAVNEYNERNKEKSESNVIRRKDLQEILKLVRFEKNDKVLELISIDDDKKKNEIYSCIKKELNNDEAIETYKYVLGIESVFDGSYNDNIEKENLCTTNVTEVTNNIETDISDETPQNVYSNNDVKENVVYGSADESENDVNLESTDRLGNSKEIDSADESKHSEDFGGNNNQSSFYREKEIDWLKGWECTCHHVNDGNFCVMCGKEKNVAIMELPKLWKCKCGAENFVNFCTKCGKKH